MLRASAEEMFLTLGRIALSPIIYEVLDMACGLVTAEGNNIPFFSLACPALV